MFIPIQVGDRTLALNKDCVVENKAIFEAVTQGISIQTELMMLNERLEVESGAPPSHLIDYKNAKTR